MYDAVVAYFANGVHQPGYFELWASILLAAFIVVQIARSAFGGKRLDDVSGMHPIWTPVLTVGLFAGLIFLDHVRFGTAIMA